MPSAAPTRSPCPPCDTPIDTTAEEQEARGGVAPCRSDGGLCAGGGGRGGTEGVGTGGQRGSADPPLARVCQKPTVTRPVWRAYHPNHAEEEDASLHTHTTDVRSQAHEPTGSPTGHTLSAVHNLSGRPTTSQQHSVRFFARPQHPRHHPSAAALLGSTADNPHSSRVYASSTTLPPKKRHVCGARHWALTPRATHGPPTLTSTRQAAPRRRWRART